MGNGPLLKVGGGGNGSGFIGTGDISTSSNNINNINNINNGNDNVDVNLDIAEGEGLPGADAPAEYNKARMVNDALDRLLTRSALRRFNSVPKSDYIGSVASAAHLGKDIKNELLAATKAVKAAMLQFGKLKGSDFTADMTWEVEKGTDEDNQEAVLHDDDGNPKMIVKMKEGSVTATIVQNAIDKQFELSSLLLDAISQIHDERYALQKDQLEEAMLECDRRISEIVTITTELTQMYVEKTADKVKVSDDVIQVQVEKQPKAEWSDDERSRLRGNLRSLVADRAKSMHWHDENIEVFAEQLDPVLAKLDEYEKNPDDPVSSDELDEFKTRISALRAVMDTALENAGSKITANIGREDAKGCNFDTGFFEKLADELKQAFARLDKVRENAVRATRRRYINNDIPLVGYLLKQGVIEKIRTFGTNKDERNKCGLFADILTKTLNVRTAMLAYADNPSDDNRKQILKARKALVYVYDEDDLKNALDVLCGASLDSVADTDLRATIRTLQTDGWSYSKRDDFLKDFRNNFRSLADDAEFAVVFDNLVAIGRNFVSDGKVSSELVKDMFAGRTSVSTAVELRVHGYGDDDIDPRLDDVNVESATVLGKGAFNTVKLVTFKDGSKQVFKPDFAGHVAMGDNSPAMTEVQKTLHLTAINRAVNKTADILGLDDVMIKTRPGVLKGVFGMYMDLAPGDAVFDFTRLPSRGGSNKIRVNTVRRYDSDDKRAVKGQIMRQCNRLKWLDILIGQFDRTNSNYFVEVSNNRDVSVKAIDNDLCFSPVRTGLYTYELSSGKDLTKWINQLSEQYGDGAKREAEAAKKDKGLKFDKNGVVKVDVSKVKSPVLLQALEVATGCQQFGVPDEIDEELYNTLVGMKEPTSETRQKLLNEWRDRFGADSRELKSAIGRLNDAIKHAESLKQKNRVYSVDQWKSDEVQSSIERKPPYNIKDRRDFPRKVDLMYWQSQNRNIGGGLDRGIVEDMEFLMADNYYIRDFYKYLK